MVTKPIFDNDLKELVDVLEAIFLAQEAYVKAKADGKLDLSDILYLLPVVEKADDAIVGINKIPLAWKTATEAEKQVVYNYFVEAFDIPNDKIEVKIEKIVLLLYVAIDVFVG